jgi:hypothetical protein
MTRLRLCRLSLLSWGTGSSEWKSMFSHLTCPFEVLEGCRSPHPCLPRRAVAGRIVACRPVPEDTGTSPKGYRLLTQSAVMLAAPQLPADMLLDTA